MTFKIAHISDTHLGYRALPKNDPETGRNQRALDVERAYRAAIDDILKRNVDLVIHSGDVFHQSRPSWAAMRWFVRQTRRLEEAGLPTVIVAGNHDTPRLRSAGTMFSVLELALPRTKFAVGYETETFRFPDLDLVVTAVPHGCLTNPLPPFVYPEAEHRNILAIHGAIANAELVKEYREAGEVFIPDTLLDKQFDYIALGHIHQHARPLSNGWYAGSTERFAWDDAGITPGYALVTLEGDEPPAVEHIALPTRPFVVLEPLDGDALTAREIVDRIATELRDKVATESMVRVQLLNTPRSIKRETESILRRETAGLVWWIELTSPRDLLAGFSRQNQEGPSTDLLSLFDAFVKEQAFDDRFAAAFLARGKTAIEDALKEAELSSGPEDAVA
jgi:DNA repair exonuclease SbcCD nuclease subunit